MSVMSIPITSSVFGSDAGLKSLCARMPNTVNVRPAYSSIKDIMPKNNIGKRRGVNGLVVKIWFSGKSVLFGYDFFE